MKQSNEKNVSAGEPKLSDTEKAAIKSDGILMLNDSATVTKWM